MGLISVVKLIVSLSAQTKHEGKKSFACLIRHDPVVRIYISIQLRKHRVRRLGTNVSKRGKFEILIRCATDITDGTTVKERSDR